MGILGLLLIFLSIPLFINYANADEDKRNRQQLRIGMMLAVVGLVVMVIPQ